MRAQSEFRGAFRGISRWILVLVLCVWFPGRAHASFPHHDGLHKEIEGLELDWRDALLTNNIAETDRLVADDYLGISANGTLETKADLIAARRSGAVKITQLDLSDIKIRVYGDTAVVTSKADVMGTNDGHDVSGHYRYTRVYNKLNGEWKVVSFEASRVSSTPENADKR